MAIREVPVDPEFQGSFLAALDVMPVMIKMQDPAFPGTDRKIDSGEQRTDPATGFPMWDVTLAVKTAPTAKAETMSVKVPGKSDPSVLVGQRVVFGGLRAAFHSFGLSGGWMFSADTVSSATAPSARPVENGKASVTASA
jgi:hypothetical protein